MIKKQESGAAGNQPIDNNNFQNYTATFHKTHKSAMTCLLLGGATCCLEGFFGYLNSCLFDGLTHITC